MAIVIKPKNNLRKNKEEIDKFLKAFKKKVKESGVLKIYHDRMYYQKPSEVKRHKRLIGKYRAQQETIRNRE